MITNDPKNQPNRINISWPEFDDAVQDVTDKIVHVRNRHQFTNDMILGITSGGLPLMTGVINRLKHKFNYTIDNLQIATTSAYRPCVKSLAQQFNDHIDTGNQQSRLWIFEDIIDTGSTITNLISRLTNVGKLNIQVSNIYCCTIVNRMPGNLVHTEWGVNLGDVSVIASQHLPFDPSTFVLFPWDNYDK